MGMWDDVLRRKREPTRRELKKMNEELLHGAADMAARLEYCINKYKIPIEELDAIKAPL